jgi:glycosyltransferase involved in cell wall biosynthesis
MKILYLASDPVPSPKGASVRILRTVETMRALGHEVELFTPLPDPETPFLERMMALRQAAERWLDGRRADLVQFRGIWEGVPAVAWAKRAKAKSVYEAHGFPSIELAYHYPDLPAHDALVRKIIAEEQALLAGADRLVTPSRTGARFLLMRGARADRIDVVPNAVDPELFSPSPEAPPDVPPYRLVYEGTLSPWQGLETLLEALARLKGRSVELHVVGPLKSAWRDEIRSRARRLRVHHELHLSGAMDQRDLVPVLRTAHVCLAPLPSDPRNAVQGCCPIKILEYMGAGRPILATSIPPVEEILEHAKTAWLVPPGSPAELADGLGWMLDHPEERETLALAARTEAVARWSPARFRERLASALANI